ncbi:hypothetical protein LUTEI9C_10013 [Luteimonas sp. 9C]|nr:hypothetical protein LUTEI9C_10013 [Luteimonas sp. 9C]
MHQHGRGQREAESPIPRSLRHVDPVELRRRSLGATADGLR